MKQGFQRIERFFGVSISIAANIVTIAGGLTAATIVIEPDILKAYLDKIGSDVNVIAQSVPLWPVLEDMSFYFTPPSSALLSFVVQNPRNLVINDFEVQGSYQAISSSSFFEFDGPALVPPTETVSFSAEIIREPWFFNAGSEFQIQICLSGSIEGHQGRFFEKRSYMLRTGDIKPVLTSRDFLDSEESSSCW